MRISVNRKNGHILTRSARVPETTEAAVATKTIWKNQPDIVEWLASLLFAASITAAVAVLLRLCLSANECNLTRGWAVEQVERTYEATDEVAIH